MILKRGNMWDSKADLICVTGNATVRKDGCLVMGRGAALEAQNKFPGINAEFGEILKLLYPNGFNALSEPYGLLVCVWPPMPFFIGLFQVKWHFRDDASLSLIQHSAAVLAKTALKYDLIAVNFPGIGYGRRARAESCRSSKCCPITSRYGSTNMRGVIVFAVVVVLISLWLMHIAYGWLGIAEGVAIGLAFGFAAAWASHEGEN